VDTDQNFGLVPRGGPPEGISPILAAPIQMAPVRPTDSYNWEQAMRVLRKNRRFAIGFAALVTILVGIAAYMMKDVYQPVARLEVDPPSSGIFTLRELENAAENNQDYQETQAQILQSDALAMSVIRALHLDKNPALVGAKNLARYGHGEGPKQTASSLDLSEKALFKDQFEVPDRTPLESVALGVFQKQLNVNTVRNSRLIEVSYASHDPRLSQQIVNNLISTYIDQNYRTRYATTMQTSEWLSGQLDDLRDKVKQSAQALVDYQRKFGLIESDDKDVTSTQSFAESSHRLSEAKADRIQLEAYIRMIDTGQSDSLPQIRDNQLHQSLTSRYVEARAQLAQARAVYGDENANVKKLQDEVNELQAQIDADQTRIVSQIRTAYAAAEEKEGMLQNSMDREKVQMGDVSERMVQYRVLKNDAFANTELYHALSARLKEAGITAGLRSNNIRVVDPASKLETPTGPQRSLIIGIGAIISGIFGVALAFVKESLNNTVRTPDDIKDWTGLPSLAMVPPISMKNDGSGLLLATLASEHKKGGRLLKIPSARAHTVEAEAMRALRTSLMLSRPGEPPRVILVASSASGEGKTTIAANLAIVFAQHGKTCIVDGDLRRPMVANAFGLPSTSRGLSHVLAGSVALEKVLVEIPEIPGLSLLPVGLLPPNPADLVASEQMRAIIASLRENFDHVVIDSPPTIPFADARVLSSMTDGVVLVGRCGLTTRRAIMRCTQLLDEVRAPIIGVVVNGIDVSSADYHYYNYGFSNEFKAGYAYRNENYNGNSKQPPPLPPQNDTKSKSAHA
jgi:polysaccharide biosynthesis transport protein